MVNTASVVLSKRHVVILCKSLTKRIIQKLEKSYLLSGCIFLCDILYSQNLRSIHHKDAYLCKFITKTSFIDEFITITKIECLSVGKRFL